ncbi:DNA-binding protein [Candidatus Saccharibacteria bacterium CPR2]|nr:DNA-binding protein [Candidatus Saccharibacteria bacterium CPR2]
MIYKRVDDGYFVRVDSGELLVKQLTQLSAELNIRGASISGVGSSEWAEVGFYHQDKKQYEFKKLQLRMEIVSLSGSIARDEQGPVIHLHGVLSDHNLQCAAGHIREICVGATCEIYIKQFQQTIERAHDSVTGLKLIQP